VPVWNGSYRRGASSTRDNRHILHTDRAVLALTLPCPSSSHGRHSRTPVAVLPNEPSCIRGGSSGQEMEDTVEAQVFRRGERQWLWTLAAVYVEEDSGVGGGGGSGGRGTGGRKGRGLEVSKKGHVERGVES